MNDRPEDGYQENVEIRNHFPFLIFPHYSFRLKIKQQNRQRDLGHLSVEKPLQVIEQPEIDDLASGNKRLTTDIVKYCHACQLQKQKSRRFLVSFKDSLIGEFSRSFQKDVVKIVHGNLLHAIDIGKGFQNSEIIDKMDADNK